MKTAIEWLIKIYLQTKKIDYFDIEQAKEMEKEQIIEAHNSGKNILPPNENGEQYYNETFGGEK
jgi:uncharacterized ubiquitin-like protein YukD